MVAGFVAFVALGVAVVSHAADDGSPAPRLSPLASEPTQPELAPYMGELQRLTHKLALSVATGNSALARFYAYESLEQLRKIQRDVPEYDGQPIALLIDRISLPRLERLTTMLADPRSAAETTRRRDAIVTLVEGCNECHRSTGHGFIKISPGFETNPFNQDFSP